MSMVRSVIGGVDTHADFHVAAAIDGNGAMLGIESFPADAAGYEELLGWLVGFGAMTLVGVEGTGSWGVGLARFLHDQEVDTVEVDRPNRQKRCKVGMLKRWTKGVASYGLHRWRAPGGLGGPR